MCRLVFLTADSVVTLLALYKKGFGRGVLNTHRFFGRAREAMSSLMLLEQGLSTLESWPDKGDASRKL